MFPANIGMPAAAGPAAAAAPRIPIPISIPIYGMVGVGGQNTAAAEGTAKDAPAAGVPIAGAAAAAAAEELLLVSAGACSWLPYATAPAIGGTTIPGTFATVCTGMPQTIPRVATGALLYQDADAADAIAACPCAADAAVAAVAPVSCVYPALKVELLLKLLAWHRMPAGAQQHNARRTRAIHILC